MKTSTDDSERANKSQSSRARRSTRKRRSSESRSQRDRDDQRPSRRSESQRPQDVDVARDEATRLLLRIKARRRAHQLRGRTCKRIDGLTKWTSFFAASAGCVFLLAEFGNLAPLIAAFAVSALMLGNNVFEGQKRARKHGDAAGKYLELERGFRKRDPIDVGTNLRDWKDRILDIQSETPMLNSVLLAVSRNAVLREMKTDVLEPTQVNWLQRMCAPLIALFPHSLKSGNSE